MLIFKTRKHRARPRARLAAAEDHLIWHSHTASGPQSGTRARPRARYIMWRLRSLVTRRRLLSAAIGASGTGTARCPVPLLSLPRPSEPSTMLGGSRFWIRATQAVPLRGTYIRGQGCTKGSIRMTRNPMSRRTSSRSSNRREFINSS